MTSLKSYRNDLVTLLNGICQVPAALNASISGLSIDSRQVQKGDLFLALSGCHSSSTDHIVEAIERGANAIVAEGKLFNGRVFEDGSAVELFVDDLKHKAGVIADRFFGSPSAGISVIGVTGTNGKTSVASYLAQYLDLSGISSGLIGTLGYGLVSSGKITLSETTHTTPNVVDVHRYLAELRSQGLECVVMEVSSHGLTQGRVDGVRFDGAIFTNLSRDHLDYHGSMQAYASAKKMLFQTEGLRFAVINQDDPYAEEMKSGLAADVKLYTYGIDADADVKVSNYQLSSDRGLSLSAQIISPLGEFSIESGLMGRFNLSNLLAVISVAIAKRKTSHCAERVSQLTAVDGRMEVLRSKGQPTVVVDYAHTPDALKNVLETLKPHCKGHLRLVFGCGGDRDIGKRAEMAKIAEILADDILITDDNPRDEDPSNITNEILTGFSASSGIRVVHDRKQAIASMFKSSKENDIVLIAGKGHETWQEVKGKRTFFSDTQEVRRNMGMPYDTALKDIEIAYD